MNESLRISINRAIKLLNTIAEQSSDPVLRLEIVNTVNQLGISMEETSDE